MQRNYIVIFLFIVAFISGCPKQQKKPSFIRTPGEANKMIAQAQAYLEIVEKNFG
ncbi:MAG: hypothetical protein GY749_48950 [Desulfobacteraceae bacterium]|nr:hypothetical protein [Desulfobacteraceae bacterium]